MMQSAPSALVGFSQENPHGVSKLSKASRKKTTTTPFLAGNFSSLHWSTSKSRILWRIYLREEMRVLGVTSSGIARTSVTAEVDIFFLDSESFLLSQFLSNFPCFPLPILANLTFHFCLSLLPKLFSVRKCREAIITEA